MLQHRKSSALPREEMLIRHNTLLSMPRRDKKRCCTKTQSAAVPWRYPAQMRRDLGTVGLSCLPPTFHRKGGYLWLSWTVELSNHAKFKNAAKIRCRRNFPETTPPQDRHPTMAHAFGVSPCPPLILNCAPRTVIRSYSYIRAHRTSKQLISKDINCTERETLSDV